MKRKRLIIILVIVLALGLGYTVYSLFVHTENEFITVSQLKARADSLTNQIVRVGGKVVPGSINLEQGTKTTRFALAEGNETLTVSYRGTVPDTFKPEADVVMEGWYRSSDTFEATGFVPQRSLCNLCHG